MKPSFLLRIAAVLTFIHAVMHTVGGVLASRRRVPPPPPCWR
jgi:hypothetical protein